MTHSAPFHPGSSRRFESNYLRWKPRLDRIAAIPLAVALAPVIAVLWLLVKTTSKGPGFYSQYRLGRHGVPFRIVKLRTMKLDAEAGVGAVWSIDGDPRATKLGRFLRRSHLDELPQIFNVIRGEMCFVGPRPERPEIAEQLAKRIPRYLDRLVATPGVSGMAQLHLASDKTLDCVFKKLGFDFTYIERASWRLDLIVCLATACKLIPAIGRTLCSKVAGSEEFIRIAMETGARLQQESVKHSAELAGTPRRTVKF
jgi:lipopolysaccharide/colanic/teichoic acid biosynthesis glycosyltransferase